MAESSKIEYWKNGVEVKPFAYRHKAYAHISQAMTAGGSWLWKLGLRSGSISHLKDNCFQQAPAAGNPAAYCKAVCRKCNK